MMFKEIAFYLKTRFLLGIDLAEIQKVERLNLRELELLNFKKRKEILKYAYENIPFYKDYYKKCSFNPQVVVTEDDWNLVPIINKELIKENHKEFLNPNLKRSLFRESSTGGSTGKPLKVFFDKRVQLEAFGWRTLGWWGITPSEDQAYVHRNVKRGPGNFINKIMWWPTKRILLDSSSMTNESMRRFIQNFNNLKPSLLQGYVGGIYELAKLVDESDLKVHSPKAIWVTSAPLSESSREFIQKVFQAPVYDQYGCGEVFWLAAECKSREGLHFLNDIRHIEFIDDNVSVALQGEFGDVAITDLENRVFPIIRYKNGDSGRFLNKSCTCGLPFPLIDKIKGRITDNIKTPGGKIINGSYLTTIFDDFPELVSGFQIVQNKDYSIEINCTISQGQSKNNTFFQKLNRELLAKTDNEVPIAINFVESLINDRGKMKFVISNLE